MLARITAMALVSQAKTYSQYAWEEILAGAQGSDTLPVLDTFLAEERVSDADFVKQLGRTPTPEETAGAEENWKPYLEKVGVECGAGKTPEECRAALDAMGAANDQYKASVLAAAKKPPMTEETTKDKASFEAKGKDKASFEAKGKDKASFEAKGKDDESGTAVVFLGATLATAMLATL